MSTSPFKIEVRHSGSAGAWVDITGYVLPNWQSDDVMAEDGCLNHVGGSMSFLICDRDTDKTTHYWVQLLATSTTIPELQIMHNASGSVVFYGRLQPDAYVYEGDVITGFTALSILPYADTLDMDAHGDTLLTSTDGAQMHATGWRIYDEGLDLCDSLVTDGDVATIEGVAYVIDYVIDASSFVTKTAIAAGAGGCVITRGEVGQYSGGAESLYRRALRRAGCKQGSVYDCVIRNYKRGETQLDMDWNPSARYWSDATVEMSDDTTSEVLPYVNFESLTTVGFVLKHGRLFRINELGELSEIVDSAGAAYTTTGHRLFYFLAESGTHCMAIFEATVRRSYSRQTSQAKWGPWAASGAGVGAGIAASFIPLVGPFVAPLAAGLASYGVSALSITRRDIPNSDQFYACTGVRVLSMGNGKSNYGDNEGFGVGVIERYKAAPHVENLRYTPGDSVCTMQNPNYTSPGMIWFADWNEANQQVEVLGYFWLTTNSDWSAIQQANRTSTECGKPAGGMAGFEFNFAIGTVNGAFILTPTDAGGGAWKWKGKLVKVDRPPARFLAALRRVDGNECWANYLWGNETHQTLEQKYKDAAAAYYAPASLPVTEVQDVHNTPTGFALLCCSTHVVTLAGQDSVTVIYEAIADDNRRLLYAGYMRPATGYGVWIFAHNDNVALCQYPLPNIGGDWRAPIMVQDGGQNDLWRLFAVCVYSDTDYIITDVHDTSLYQRALIHHDFTRDKMTVAQVLRGCQSHWCYLRLNSTDPCESPDDVRVVSRHSWTPKSAGTLAKDNVVHDPRIDGIEYYDGAVCDVGGQRIEAGDVTVGKRVFGVQGTFLTAGWGRVIAAEVVARYPRRSATYPYGRRKFLPQVRAVDNEDGDEVPLLSTNLFHMLAVTFLTGLDSVGFVTGMGVDRNGLVYPAKLLELAVVDEVADGVTWTNDQPEMMPADIVVPTYATVTPPANVAPTERTIDWIIPSAQLEVPVAKGSASAYVWGLMADLGAGGLYTGIKIKQLTLGVAGDEKLKCSLFTDSGNAPGVEIADTHVDYDPAGKGPGLIDADAAENPWVSGVVWLMICRENANTAQIAWRDAAVVATGYAFKGSVLAFDYPVIPSIMTATDTVPDILVRLEA